ncbi:MAG: hypothetical protein ACKO11_12550 [Cuspidothrix sp.]
MTKTTRPFTPDWVSSPGDAIAEFLEERDWTQAQLAERLGEYEGELAQLKSQGDVVDFAARIAIHSGIVVGRLQHDHLIDRSWMNGLKESFCFQGVE